MNGRFFDDLVVKLDDGFAEDFEDGRAAFGQVIVAARTLGFSDRCLGTEPAIALEALEQRIQGARADVVPMLSQFAQHPLANDRMLGRVVKDVHFPEAQQNFARQKFGVKTTHGERDVIITITVNEYRIIDVV